MTTILVLGTSGMLGSQLQKSLTANGHTVYGYSRKKNKKDPEEIRNFCHEDIFSEKTKEMIDSVQPDYLANCIGIIKQRADSQDELKSIQINSLLPHFLHKLCLERNVRLIHFSTDCVFTGKQGGYRETDMPDSTDIYGRSKLLGEVTKPYALTIRTSIIGHEVSNKRSLLEWAISSKKTTVKGFKNAIFSGLTTVEMANILHRYVIESGIDLSGLYHVSANPISKYDLLQIVSEEYHLGLDILPEYSTNINRHLNSDRFQLATGYKPKPWANLIAEMKKDYMNATND